MFDKINPYSQHYRAMPRLIGSAVLNDIFQYLLDEHLCNLRKGLQSRAISCTATIIAENVGVNRKSVTPNLTELNDLGLIEYDKENSLCYIQSDFLVGVVTLFNTKETFSEKKSVASAFRSHDIHTLKSLGLEIKSNSDNLLKALNGNLEVLEQESMSENGTECPKTVQDDQKRYGMSNNGTECPKTVRSDQNWYGVSVFGHLYEVLMSVFGHKSACLEAIIPYIDDSEVKNNVTEAIDVVYSADYENPEDLDVRFWTSLVSVFGHCVPILDNRNKYIKEKIKKENTQRSALVTKEKDSDEFFETEEEFFDLKKPLEVLELKPSKTVEELSENSPRTSSLSFPIIPVGEIDRIISDTEYASQNSLKLFINEVWLSLSEYFEMDIEESDDEISNNFEIEGQGFPFEDFQRNILEVAYEQVAGYLAQGFVEVGDRQIPVTFTEMFPAELIGQIFRWEKTALAHNETVLKISKTGIYDVTAEKVEKVSQPKTRAEKRQATKDSLRYMTKILEWEDKPMLTSMENIVKYCIHQFLIPEPTEDGYSRFVINKESQAITDEGALTKTAWRQLQELLKDYHISEQQFFSCLMGNPVPNQYEQLTIQPCMFYADGIRAFHKLRGELSAID